MLFSQKFTKLVTMELLFLAQICIKSFSAGAFSQTPLGELTAAVTSLVFEQISNFYPFYFYKNPQNG